ncbi:MAG: hypothetical protein Q7S68_04330 [Deltaproteobacteria bacterium]|nr:hypothetical protein [Deltaproteobacteria bacterium]
MKTKSKFILFLVLLFLPLVAAAESPSDTYTPTEEIARRAGLDPSKQEVRDFVNFLKGVAWCCGLENMSRCDAGENEEADSHRILSCIFSNSGMSYGGDFIHFFVDHVIEEQNAEGQRMIRGMMNAFGITDVIEMIDRELFGARGFGQWEKKMPNPDYLRGQESARRCSEQFLELARGESDIDCGCTMTVTAITPPSCREDAGSNALVIRGLATGNAGIAITSISYSVHGDRGFNNSGSCEGSSCEARIPASELQEGEELTVEMIAHTDSTTCEDSKKTTVRLGELHIAEPTFNIDPLVYEVKGMNRTLNPYDDHKVTTYDDLLLQLRIPGVSASQAAKLRLEYKIDASVYREEAKLSSAGLERSIYNTGAEDEGRDQAGDQTEEIIANSPADLKRNGPKWKYSPEFCTVDVTIPIANRWTHRGEAWRSEIRVKERQDDGTERMVFEQALPLLHVADYNFVFLKNSGGDLRSNSQEALDFFLSTPGNRMETRQAKAIFRDESSCGGTDFDNPPQCARDMKEHWNNQDTLAVLTSDIGRADFHGGILFFHNPTPQVFAHEMGHTYGFCEEYEYEHYLLEEYVATPILGASASGLGECRNTYPKCCNDHPSEPNKTEANNCYNIFHADMGTTSEGTTWYSDTLPTEDGDNFCMGRIMGCDGTVTACGTENIRRSVMGCGTSQNWLTRGMRGGAVQLEFPDTVPITRINDNE